MNRKTTSYAATLCLLCNVGCAIAQMDMEEDYQPPPEERGANMVAMTNAYKANLKKYKGNKDVFVREGVVANRKDGEVVITAEATGLGGSVEFFLIGLDSDHDYEALAVSLASPSNVWHALRFLGLKTGEGVDPVALRFWPKGEKVSMLFRLPEGPDEGALVPAELFIIDDRDGEPIEETGFVFVGATVESAGGPRGDKRIVAEAYQPHSIAATFSCGASLLDVARNAPQGEVYEYQAVNPEYALKEGVTFEVVLKVGKGTGLSAPRDLSLRTYFAPGTEGPLKFDLREREGSKAIVTNVTLDKVLAAYEEMIGEKQEPHIEVSVGGEIELTTVRNLAMLLGVTDTDGGVRIDSPPAGEFYYKAFLPDDRHRDRNDRILQPWELHLEKNENTITGRLEKTTEKWHKDKPKPELIVDKFEVKSTKQLGATLEKQGKGIPVFLIYAPKEMLYGELQKFVKPVLEKYSTIYVFLD